MALRDIFKFRELPERETSKPFLEHLEDLRWTIVKMAITLVAAMIVCFAFRSTLVRVLQAPLRDVGSQIGTLKALGITDSIVISFHLAFYAGIVLSFPLLLYFIAEFVLPALTAVEKRFLFPAILVSFALFLLGVTVCYFWLLPKTILFFLSRHRVARLGTHLDGATILFLCDAIYNRFRVGFRIASGSAGLGSIWFDYLQVHGAHTTLRCRADIYSGDDHHADTRHSDLGRDGAPDVPAL
jgi:Tat protein translocase TatC